MNSPYTQEYKKAAENFSAAKGYAMAIGETFAGLGKETLKGRALRDKQRKAKKAAAKVVKKGRKRNG